LFQNFVTHSGPDLSILAAPADDKADWWQAFGQALVIVFSAEMFDKTWFVTLIYALAMGSRVAFLGSYSALALHTAISAGLGAALSKVLAGWLLHFATAAIFATFASFYAYEFYKASPDDDALQGRTQEAQESLEQEGEDSKAMVYRDWRSALLQVFVAVFIAEWGDRTQVAMISLHASLPILPVVLGSLVAFFLACSSAVLLARVLESSKLSERTISGTSAVSFFLFAVVALVSGIQEFGQREGGAS